MQRHNVFHNKKQDRQRQKSHLRKIHLQHSPTKIRDTSRTPYSTRRQTRLSWQPKFSSSLPPQRENSYQHHHLTRNKKWKIHVHWHQELLSGNSYEVVCIQKKIIPQEVLDKYDIIFDDQDFTYLEICRGIYVLKEAGVIAFDQLVQKLKRFGYESMPQTPGLWRHTSRKTTFTLCINNFGIQYFSKAKADHLIEAIQDIYECSIDWKGTQ